MAEDAIGTGAEPRAELPRCGPPRRARSPGSYVVGLVNHRSYEDLERCLASVKQQTLPPEAIVVMDVDADRSRHAEALRRHPEAAWIPMENRGFGAAANRVLRKVAAEWPGAEAVLLLNPDVELRPDFAALLLRAMERDPQVGIASGKLLRPDGRTFDSTGIELPRHRRPRDRGSEERDRGQYDRPEYVFAVSGAAFLLRCSTARDLEVEGQVFDEDFFLYHEDTDLCWRAALLGWRVLYEPSARAVHGRRWRRDRRFQMPASVRRHSFKNHYLSLLKNERGSDFLRNLPILVVWEVARLGYALARDRAVLGGYAEAWRLRGAMRRKRRVLRDRAASRGGSAPRSD